MWYQTDGNYFTGLFPTEIAGLSSIVKIEIGEFSVDRMNLRAQFSKVVLTSHIIVPWIFAFWSFSAGGSTLKGTIPTELSNLKGTLQKLDLKDNDFSGNIPSEYGSLTKLNYLDLGKCDHHLYPLRKEIYMLEFSHRFNGNLILSIQKTTR